ncbi:MAG: hypothetical protein ACREVF_04130 [Burkholderiales bacterium]
MRNTLLYSGATLALLLLSLGSAALPTPWVSPRAAAYSLDEIDWIRMKADLNGDGVLSREEILEEDASLLAKFDDADLDHDGTLSPGEFELLLITGS